eukprot:comp20312_c0_seq1/m.25526 comp20312_c0_seq1/g.25526  ORF comp20312_c0_seq1/g.25526 comp20312_c0_seq1/m.25526 type:complete len:474 (-) comp20312_c0_seq1:65-1486(-)
MLARALTCIHHTAIITPWLPRAQLQTKRIGSWHKPPQTHQLSSFFALLAQPVRHVHLAQAVSRNKGSKLTVGGFTVRGKRFKNEDTLAIAEFNTHQGPVVFAAVCDGHGGNQASEFVASRLPPLVERCLMDNPSLSLALTSALKTADTEFTAMAQRLNKLKVGTCVVAALVRGDTMVVANVGDCQAWLHNAECTSMLSRNHNPYDPDEVARITAANGELSERGGTLRLQGVLAVTRAIGDLAFRDVGLTAEPTVVERQVDDADRFLLLASDGLFDSLTGERSCSIGRFAKTPLEAAKRLTLEAEMGASEDNITTVVIPLKGWAGMHEVVEETPMYKFFHTQGGSSDGSVGRLLMLMEAYLPPGTTLDQLESMRDEFIKHGEGPFGRVAFKVFDHDCNGFVDVDEFVDMMRTLGSGYSNEQLEALFHLADHGENGCIGLTDFKAALRSFLVHDENTEHAPLPKPTLTNHKPFSH